MSYDSTHAKIRKAAEASRLCVLDTCHGPGVLKGMTRDVRTKYRSGPGSQVEDLIPGQAYYQIEVDGFVHTIPRDDVEALN